MRRVRIWQQWNAQRSMFIYARPSMSLLTINGRCVQNFTGNMKQSWQPEGSASQRAQIEVRCAELIEH
jgi:hypothetical protein